MVSSLECLVDRKYQFLHFFFNSSACTTFEGSYRLPDMWSLVILCSVVVASVLSLPTSTQLSIAGTIIPSELHRIKLVVCSWILRGSDCPDTQNMLGKGGPNGNQNKPEEGQPDIS
uniref:Neur_chan_memb domain-containing protein n=1 Tax=Heterorhabditis bacteriophora TaxID=37862 RepID=A0A1I7WDW6_HETBA